MFSGIFLFEMPSFMFLSQYKKHKSYFLFVDKITKAFSNSFEFSYGANQITFFIILIRDSSATQQKFSWTVLDP